MPTPTMMRVTASAASRTTGTNTAGNMIFKSEELPSPEELEPRKATDKSWGVVSEGKVE